MNIVIFTFVVSLFFAAIGIAVGKSSIASECLQTGSFHKNSVVFICKPQGATR